MSESYLEELFGLDGQVAVVIGGTGVLGGALAQGLAQAGATVVVAGRDPERGEARVAGDRRRPAASAAFAPVDVMHRDVDRGAAATMSLDDAGPGRHARSTARGSTTPAPTSRSRTRTGTASSTATSRPCTGAARSSASRWPTRGGGSILNIASVSAHLPLSRVFAYSASKAAVVNLTQNVARELAPLGVRVNALCPGFFPAEQNRKILDPRARREDHGADPDGPVRRAARAGRGDPAACSRGRPAASSPARPITSTAGSRHAALTGSTATARDVRYCHGDPIERDGQPGSRGPGRAVRLLGRPGRRPAARPRRSASTPSRSSPSARTRSTPAGCASLLDDHGLALAAVGTGAGWVRQRLHLCLPDASGRAKAREFIRSIIDFAGRFGAPAIIGSMQGRSGDGSTATRPLGYLTEALEDLGEHAAAVRRAPDLRAAEPLRDEPGQHGRGGVALLRRSRPRTSCCWPTCST